MSDLSITAANLQASPNARYRRVIAGATATRGQLAYLDTSDGNRAKPADADAQASARIAGIFMADAAAGQPLDIVVHDPDLDIGATTVAGTPYFASVNAGGICPFADLGSGDYVSLAGIGKASNKLHFASVISETAIP